jgi:lipopolysaccharide transport protein LptA
MKRRRTEPLRRRLLAGLLSLGASAAWAQPAVAPGAAAAVAAAPAAAPAPAAPAAPASTSQSTRDELTSMPTAEDLRPTGPITITANRAEAVQGDYATYTGNVAVDSNTLKMDGDRLDLKRSADGQYTLKLTGAPAHIAHPSSGPDDPQVFAHGKTVNYDSRSGIVDLIGEAYFKRGDDVTTSDTIRYDVVKGVYEGNGRVTIVIPPASPAPAPAAAAPANPAPAGTHP